MQAMGTERHDSRKRHISIAKLYMNLKYEWPKLLRLMGKLAHWNRFVVSDSLFGI